jgi:hypothetical protein
VRDLKKYWKEVREMERNLPPFVWLMSLEDDWRGLTGGVLTEVPAPEAAKLLHSKSHRIGTAEEIAAHLEKQSAAVRRAFHEGLRKRGVTIIPVPENSAPEVHAPEPGAAEQPTGVRTRNLR